MKPILRGLGALVLVMVAVLLGGCATTRKIDSEVRSFAGAMQAQNAASFRFEHLPSQQAAQALQDRLEELATAALVHKGLVRDDAAARYAVLLQVRAEQYTGPAIPGVLPGHFMLEPHGHVWHRWPFLEMETTQYRHAVDVLIRDIASGQVVYESRAIHDGPWSDSFNLLPAILEAALHDYPQAAPVPHTVVVELPPAPPGARR